MHTHPAAAPWSSDLHGELALSACADGGVNEEARRRRSGMAAPCRRAGGASLCGALVCPQHGLPCVCWRVLWHQHTWQEGGRGHGSAWLDRAQDVLMGGQGGDLDVVAGAAGRGRHVPLHQREVHLAGQALLKQRRHGRRASLGQAHRHAARSGVVQAVDPPR